MNGRCRKGQTLSLVLIKLPCALFKISIKDVNSIHNMSCHPLDKTQVWQSEQYKCLQIITLREMVLRGAEMVPKWL